MPHCGARAKIATLSNVGVSLVEDRGTWFLCV